MLVLTRKLQEKIRIGDGITITVLRTKGKAVRLGIEASAEVPVIRGELAIEDPPSRPLDRPASDARRAIGAEDRPARAPWPSSADPRRAIQGQRGEDATACVSLQRVPREERASVLPRLAASGGPLRGLLDQRTSLV